MNKLISKYKFPIFIIFLGLILIVLSYFFNLKQKKIADHQRLLQEQKNLKEAQERIELKNYLMGKFDQTQRNDFVLIPKQYSTIPKKNMYLRKETLSAFIKMAEAASKDKINLKIASATRNFEYQKNLWNNKWSGVTPVEGKNLFKSIPNKLKRFKKILEYSAVPGTSRHHWGTDIDINDANPKYFKTEKGEDVYEWLSKNAPSYGFCQPYTQKGTARPTGYNEEKWHWSYLPLAKTFTKQYKNLIKENDINNFLGEENVTGEDLINDYVLGINSECI